MRAVAKALRAWASAEVEALMDAAGSDCTVCRAVASAEEALETAVLICGGTP